MDIERLYTKWHDADIKGPCVKWVTRHWMHILAAFSVLIKTAFWVTVLYVSIHFITKYW